MIDQFNELHAECCPICLSAIKLWRVKSTRHGEFKIDKCLTCGFAFVNPRPSMKFIEAFYSAGGHGDWTLADNVTAESILQKEKEFPNSTKDAERIFSTVDTLGLSSGRRRLLDVGCGYGFFSREALARGFTVDAMELAPRERELAREMTGQEPLATTFEDFIHEENYYSMILMSQILEHARDAVGWVNKARNLLADEGMLVIAVPNFEGIFRWVMQENEPYIIPPAHLNYFARKSLTLLLEAQGFEVEKVQWVSRILPVAFEKRFGWTGKFGLSLMQIASSNLMRTIDLLRMGLFLNIYARRRS